MSGNKAKIDGVRCALITRGTANGEYTLLFDRRLVTLEQIEAINWAKPELTGDYDPLPAGYGFEATGITYSSSDQTYRVQLRVLRQYLGDVTGYQAQVAELEGTVAKQKEAIEAKEDVIQTQQETIGDQKQTLARQTEKIQGYQEQMTAQAASIQEKDQTIQTQQTEILGYTASVAGFTAAVVSIASISTELPDELALDMAELAPDCFPAWEVVLQVGAELAQGRIIEKDGHLYRVVQPVMPQAHQEPGGEGMLAIYRPIDREHAGTLEDPIPWVYGMDCLAGLYYSYEGAVYRVADGGNMVPCVWAPDTPRLWQWELVGEAG